MWKFSRKAAFIYNIKTSSKFLKSKPSKPSRSHPLREARVSTSSKMRSSSSDECEIKDRGGGGGPKTVVLVGKTGNGKSATGNTIIGRRVFKSKFSFGGVTSSCQLETTVLDGGQTLNVIDTPGLFDSRDKFHVMAKKIADCIELAKDGIHALLLVLSLHVRFTEEEASAFESLCEIFGRKISDYMIVVFTHGDLLEDDMCLDDLLGDNCPEILKNILEMCGNRIVVFDNKSKDEIKIRKQRKELLSLVDNVVEKNGGKPYTNELFHALKREQMRNQVVGSREGEFHHSNKQQFERLIGMVESRMKESILNLEKQLAEERAARAEAQLKEAEARTQSKGELQEMKERLRRAEEKSRELQNKLNNRSCAIM